MNLVNGLKKTLPHYLSDLANTKPNIKVNIGEIFYP